MYSIVYASSAIRLWSREELSELLNASRRNNEALDVTGMLLYKGGNFLQVLEGPKGAVTELFEKILKDPRHRHCCKLLQGEERARAFPEWNMGFRDLQAPDFVRPAGFSEFLNTELKPEEFSAQPTEAQKLLSLFKERM